MLQRPALQCCSALALATNLFLSAPGFGLAFADAGGVRAAAALAAAPAPRAIAPAPQARAAALLAVLARLPALAAELAAAAEDAPALATVASDALAAAAALGAGPGDEPADADAAEALDGTSSGVHRPRTRPLHAPPGVHAVTAMHALQQILCQETFLTERSVRSLQSSQVWVDWGCSPTRTGCSGLQQRLQINNRGMRPSHAQMLSCATWLHACLRGPQLLQHHQQVAPATWVWW